MNEFVQVVRRKIGKPPDFKLFGAGSREVRDGREASLGNDEVVVDVVVVPGCAGAFKPLGVAAAVRLWVAGKVDVEGAGTLLGPLAEVAVAIVDFASAEPNRGPWEMSTRRGPCPFICAAGTGGRGGTNDLRFIGCRDECDSGSVACSISCSLAVFLVFNGAILDNSAVLSEGADPNFCSQLTNVESVRPCPLGLGLFTILRAGRGGGSEGKTLSLLILGVTS